jgi:hypothetical protein
MPATLPPTKSRPLLVRPPFLPRQAVMETAISSTLRHPNIVSTFTYAGEGSGVEPPGRRAWS